MKELEQTRRTAERGIEVIQLVVDNQRKLTEATQNAKAEFGRAKHQCIKAGSEAKEISKEAKEIRKQIQDVNKKIEKILKKFRI